MRTGRHLDIGRLTMDESIRPKLDAFMNEHRAEFRLKWWETTLVTGSIAAALVAFWLLFELLA
jgi:hypothetical protein